MARAATARPERSEGVHRSSLEKMLEILDLFDDASHRRWTPEDMMERLSCPRSTLYRHLRVLTNAGLVTSLPDVGYTLGPRIAELDYEMRSSDPLIVNGRPLLQVLVQEIAGIGLLCRYYKNRVLCVHQEASANASGIQSGYERGRAMPLVFGATSRVILAHLRLPQLRQIYELQAREFSRSGGDHSFEDLQQSLRQIRKQGYCSSRGEVTPGLIGIAAPVFDSENTVIGSLTMTVAEAGTNDRRLRPIVDRVVFSANVLTNSLRQRG